MKSNIWAVALLLGLGGLLIGALGLSPSGSVEVAGYATSLKGRTRNQKRNARLAASALDGLVIAPGATFSFNRAVKSWSLDQGYVKAPVSFDGELVRAYGGGVCQTSTTLYNAALLAGLPILERHPHVFRPRYIAPGRDAAVAYPGVDLRFKNPHAWPLTIHARASGEVLEVSLWGREAAHPVRVTTRIISQTQPARLTRIVRGPTTLPRVALRSPGATGYRVVTYRLQSGLNPRRERLSDDIYPAMNRIIALSQDEVPRS